MAAVFLFIWQDLNRLLDRTGSLQKRSFCGANGILPPQPLKAVAYGGCFSFYLAGFELNYRAFWVDFSRFSREICPFYSLNCEFFVNNEVFTKM